MLQTVSNTFLTMPGKVMIRALIESAFKTGCLSVESEVLITNFSHKEL